MIDLFKVRSAPEAAAAVALVLASGYIGQGPQCAEFERAFGELVGAPEPPLLLNSCTSAIDLALHLSGVVPDGRRHEVITTPITCTATNSPIVTRGGRIIWADVDPLTGLIDPADVARKVTKHTRAVIGVDWGGRVCRYRDLVHASMQRQSDDVHVIADAAHGPIPGDFANNRPTSANPDGVGTHHWADHVCWSFQAIKHLTTGDGGALWSTRHSDRERAKLLRWYGLDRESGADFRCAQNIQEIGYKYQSNDIAAAIGLANLPGLTAAVARGRENAAYYCRWLTDLPGIDVPPYDPTCSYWLMTLCVDDRADFMAHLAAKGIATSQVHARNDKHDAFRAVSESRGPLPGVDAFDARQVSIPVGWWVSDREREYIAATVHTWAMERSRRAA